MNKHILEKVDLVAGFAPINIGSARTGDTISLKHHNRCAIVFFKGAGSASEDPTLTVEQCKSVAPSNAKALNFTRVDTKQGTLNAVGTWTKVEQAAGNTYTNATASENEALWVVDIKAEDLDLDNGYDCLRVTVADAGSVNQLASVLYILHDPKFSENLSPIID